METSNKLTRAALNVPLLHINEVTIFAARDYSRKLRKEKFDMEVWLPKYCRNLQRELCWTVDDKEALIRSMLYGNYIAPISAVIAYKDDKDIDGYYQIIDGKQRLTAIFDFIENAYPVRIDDKLYYYDDFDIDLQQALLKNAPIINLCIEEMSDDDKIAWYLRLNYAGAANYLKLCLEKPDATDEDFQRIAISYLDNEVDTIVKISEDHVLRILPKKRDEASTGCIWYVRMNGVWFFADTLAVRPEDRAPKEDVELISKYL